MFFYIIEGQGKKKPKLNPNSKFTSLTAADNFYFRLSLTERRVFHTALQVFKIVNRISPPYLHEIFSFAVDVTGRNQHGLFVPRVNTDYG